MKHILPFILSVFISTPSIADDFSLAGTWRPLSKAGEVITGVIKIKESTISWGVIKGADTSPCTATYSVDNSNYPDSITITLLESECIPEHFLNRHISTNVKYFRFKEFRMHNSSIVAEVEHYKDGNINKNLSGSSLYIKNAVQ